MEVKGGHVETARAKKIWIVSTEPISKLDSDVVSLAHNKGWPGQDTIEDENWPFFAAVRDSPWSVSEELLQCEVEDARLWLVRRVAAPSPALLPRVLCYSPMFSIW